MRSEGILRGLAAAALVAAALAGPRLAAARPPGSPDGLISRHAERLGLDEGQREAIEHIAAESRERSRALREEIGAARARLRELLASAELDRDAVLAQAGVLEDLYAQAHRNRLVAILEIHARLTPEQRAELVRIRTEEGPRRGHGRCDPDEADAQGP